MTTRVIDSETARVECNECHSMAPAGSTKKHAEDRAYQDGYYTITFWIERSKFIQHACSRECKTAIVTRLHNAQLSYEVTGYFMTHEA